MRILLLSAFLLTGCAAADGEWPSLARRPAEVVVAPAPEAAPAVPAASAPVPAAITARIEAAAREADEIAERLKAQIAVVAAARGGAAGSPGWAALQLEISRLEKIGNQLAEARRGADAIAGDLAAAGADALAAGALIARIESLRAEYQSAFDAAQARAAV
jgi:predicted amidohydrolase